MRQIWKLGFLWLVIMALALHVAAQTAQPPAKPTPAKPISGAGCVEAGVEAGCLVLKDTKTMTLYNLFFTGKKPAVNTAIRFTGTPKSGVTTCMQGTAVDVEKWTPIRMHCPVPTGGTKPSSPK